MTVHRKRGEEQGRATATVSHLAATVTRLRTLAERMPAKAPPAPAEVSAESLLTARKMVRERLRRNHFFDAGLFADPAWDMMLDLYIAEAEGRETPVMNLCLSSQVPETTTLRWVKTLEHAGIVIRQRDEHDQRRVLVRLSPDASKALAVYFDDAG